MNLYQYEKALLELGIKNICGVDEAGRGPLAGPVFAGAVILDPEKTIEGLNDSKQLSPKKRETLAALIKEKALAYAIAMVDVSEIDRINIYQASRKAMLEAISACPVRPDYVLSDAMPMSIPGTPCLPIVKGDQLSASIAAASILAKTARDEYMCRQAELYPGYGFEIHKGYPTKMHLEAIRRYGVLPIHRRTYKPIKTFLEKQMQLELEVDPNE